MEGYCEKKIEEDAWKERKGECCVWLCQTSGRQTGYQTDRKRETRKKKGSRIKTDRGRGAR